MAYISLDEAASRSGVPHQTLEMWAGRGLLTLYARPHGPPDSAAAGQFVDEEELDRVVESLGWLHLSAREWAEAEYG